MVTASDVYTINQEKNPYTVVWNPIRSVAAAFQGSISAASLKPRSSIVVITLKGENRSKMTGFLDDLLTELIEKDIQQKKEAAYNTLKFIDERVDMVAKELGMVEQDLLNFRKKGRFLSSEAEFGYYQGRISESDKLLNFFLSLIVNTSFP